MSETGRLRKSKRFPEKKPDLKADYLKEFDHEFCAAMDNDFNTAVAIACLFSLVDKIVRISDPEEKTDMRPVS